MSPIGPPPDRYALIGHPVSHSWSPFIHGMFARATLQNMQYRMIDVPPERCRAEILQFFVDGGRGLNVTLPHKQVAAELVNELTPRAQLARAVNTIRAESAGVLLGDNTDGVGLLTDLEQNLGLELRGRRILILGAGGATRGVLGLLLERRPAVLAVANRTLARATELARDFTAEGPIVVTGFDAVEQAPFDLVVNATSASLQGVAPPVPPAVVGEQTVCYDMAYGKGDTPFMRWARSHRAAAVHPGWGMLVEQAAEAFFLWRGVRPQTQQVLDLLTARASDSPP
jgi:shikimate dehydrogenase